MGEQLRHTQVVFDGENGDCVQAAVATALQLPLVAVPNFSTFGGFWYHAMALWGATRGIYVRWAPLGEPLPDADVIAIGLAARGHKHAVVWRGDHMVHDPHPDRSGLVDTESFIILERRA